MLLVRWRCTRVSRLLCALPPAPGTGKAACRRQVRCAERGRFPAQRLRSGTNYLSVHASASAPDAPEVFSSGMKIHILGDDGKELRPPIFAKTDLRLPCSAYVVYLTSRADPVSGYGDIPKDPSAITVEAVEWSSPNEPSGGNADAADLENRFATHAWTARLPWSANATELPPTESRWVGAAGVRRLKSSNPHPATRACVKTVRVNFTG